MTGKVCFQSKENESVILSPGEQAVLHLAGRLEKKGGECRGIRGVERRFVCF